METLSPKINQNLQTIINKINHKVHKEVLRNLNILTYLNNIVQLNYSHILNYIQKIKFATSNLKIDNNRTSNLRNLIYNSEDILSLIKQNTSLTDNLIKTTINLLTPNNTMNRSFTASDNSKAYKEKKFRRKSSFDYNSNLPMKDSYTTESDKGEEYTFKSKRSSYSIGSPLSTTINEIKSKYDSKFKILQENYIALRDTFTSYKLDINEVDNYRLHINKVF
jgi:hypothetical protein